MKVHGIAIEMSLPACRRLEEEIPCRGLSARARSGQRSAQNAAKGSTHGLGRL